MPASNKRCNELKVPTLQALAIEGIKSQTCWYPVSLSSETTPSLIALRSSLISLSLRVGIMSYVTLSMILGQFFPGSVHSGHASKSFPQNQRQISLLNSVSFCPGEAELIEPNCLWLCRESFCAPITRPMSMPRSFCAPRIF